MKTSTKVISIVAAVAVLAFAGWFFFKFYFVFGEGVKAGELNYLTYKGYVFKTYEGRLIQSGYNSKNATSTIQSNEFQFSIENKQVADSLMRCTGKIVELHYKEYFGALPWRGVSEFVVDSIISVSQNPASIGTPIF
ncbi:MAG: hypothetical protein NC038_03310 [Paludibacter sp.]|nr:hypothetical protein [Bacteroidales bacterium]MCM1069101.1 hypothetical protein [Prevotella sp.]MCM1353540.1 hypothetical protein [Bacteroides sp.]MCM1442701.1 hypothetical protein [Muribaculum sp.]MCM1481663.1 hypothetical protein [Paludibacter sp.]